MANETGYLTADAGREGMRPIPLEHRVFGGGSYVLMWWASLIVIQLFILGQGMLPPAGQLNLLQAAVVVLASVFIVWVFFCLNGEVGRKYGVPFAVQARPAFGFMGNRIALLVRVVPAVFWYGIGSWIGAQALDAVTQSLFGFGNVWVYFILFQALQTVLAYTGISSIKWFESVTAIVVAIILAYMAVVIISEYRVDLAEQWSTGGTWGMPFWSSLAAAVGIFITAAINASDLSRFLKADSPRANWGYHFLGLVPPWIFMISMGVISAAAAGVWDPVQALMALAPSTWVGLILLVFIVGAQMTTNLTINILPPALAITEFTGLSWGKSTIIVGILGIVTMPWVLLTSENFFKFINYYSAFLGPLLGILLADYWVVRKRNYEVDALYDPNGIYGRAAGIGAYNWNGIVALVIGGIFGAMYVEISWMVGLPIGFIIYAGLYALRIRLGARSRVRATAD